MGLTGRGWLIGIQQISSAVLLLDTNEYPLGFSLCYSRSLNLLKSGGACYC
jgi:hypothetical protein